MFDIKRTHAELADLKGTIRVFVRVRPILDQDKENIGLKLQKNYMPHSV